MAGNDSATGSTITTYFHGGAWAILASATIVLAGCISSGASHHSRGTATLETGIDSSVRAQDDFYSHVNGQWLKQTDVPADVPWTSPFVSNYLKVHEDLRSIIEDVVATKNDSSSDAQRIGDLYRSFMDENRIAAIGISPLKAELARIDGLASNQQIATLMARFNRLHGRARVTHYFGITPLRLSIQQDADDSNRLIGMIEQSGLGMANRDYYLSDDPGMAQTRSKYLDHIELILKLASDDAPKAHAQAIIALETSLARSQWPASQRRGADKTYHKMAFTKLAELAPGIDWPAYFREAGLASQSSVVVSEPSYVQTVASLVQSLPLEIWKSYFKWQLLRNYSPYLGPAFVDADFAFYGKAELGNDVNTAREKRGVIMVEASFGEPLGHLYVDRYFPDAAKRRVERMAENIRQQFHQRIAGLDWMDQATKSHALDKLAKLRIKIGYPEQWQDFSNVRIAPDDLIGNLIRIHEADYLRKLQNIGKPVDREQWLIEPQALNAYYNASTNELAIPAGYLQAPWFDMSADDALNYGGIGSTIGHEMGHAFDDQGSQYDGDGNLRDWWTTADRARFKDRTRQLTEQYNTYSPLPGKHVDGTQTLSENIGDLTGLTMAYYAYLTTLAGKRTPRIDGLTGDQRFFISFATHWRAKYRPSLLVRILSDDGHAPQQYRCNGPLVNFTPFYESFNVKAGDGMYKNPQDRTQIW